MNGADPTLEAVRRVVERVAGPGRTPPNVTAETSLSDGYWLDSIELLEVILSCEREFRVTFDAATDFDRGAFKSLGTVARLIEAKQRTDRGPS